MMTIPQAGQEEGSNCLGEEGREGRQPLLPVHCGDHDDDRDDDDDGDDHDDDDRHNDDDVDFDDHHNHNDYDVMV